MNAKPKQNPNLFDIELGNGDKIISDLYNEKAGWGGFCISNGKCSVGEIIETGAETDNDLEAFLRIRTTNPESLDVIIAACERAKARMIPKQKPKEGIQK